MKEFLNSRLFLTVLTLVAASFLPWLYQQYLSAYTKEKEQFRASYQTRAEIENRVFYYLYLYPKQEIYERNDVRFAFYGHGEQLGQAQYYNFEPLFSQFKDRSILQIVAEFAVINECIESKEYRRIRTQLELFKKQTLANLAEHEGTPQSDEFWEKAERNVEWVRQAWSDLKGVC
ncbi:hypothetical protein GYB61_10045 [bacterium]|nr:hypothetical protein [bacterium]